VVRLLHAPDAAARLAAAAAWLRARPPDDEVLVVGPSWEACDDLLRASALDAGARFGTIRLTLDRLAGRLARATLAQAGRAPASELSLTAVVARAVHRLTGENGLAYFAPVARRPGFPAAVARTVAELRMNGVAPAALRGLGARGADVAALADAVDRELADARLADRALVFEAAVAAAATAALPPAVLLLDVPLRAARETALVAALAARAADVLATAERGDGDSLRALGAALDRAPEAIAAAAPVASLGRLQHQLFDDSTPVAAALDETVTLQSWPGEARECVEIARAIQAAAARGVPFDRMAVFLRSPGDYRAHLEEALRRADIPAFFARGTSRPEPAGRALLALLACAAEKLSARRFAEYLSLGQVPDPDADADADDAWVAPDHDLLPVDGEPPVAPPDTRPARLLENPAAAPVVEGTLRAPARWERLLVEAAVIRGRDRWAARLDGLARETALKRAAAKDDDARAARLDRDLADLANLRTLALPLIDRLAALPDSASWGVWLEHLRELARHALRAPDPVLGTLAELDPMGPVGPVDLDEVRLVLTPRLRELAVRPPRRRYGAVLVASTEAARGLAFDCVFVPGLAEKLFPRKIVEDPILPDVARDALGVATLATRGTAGAAERLALRLAAGAARRTLALSYPRLDVEQARARVPSFYALEALRAAEGRLPGFDELGVRAEPEAGARLGWPAPKEPERAIDEAEFDLAILAPLLDVDDATVAGTARSLMTANPHLARALRARARRWLRRWTIADGLVEPDATALEALATHGLGQRSYSPTALQHFAACPYRFVLQALHRLQPREEPVAIETIDPLTRGGLFHDVQFAILTELARTGALPVRRATLDAALAVADAALDRVAGDYEAKLYPAIQRVWDDGVDGIRADLREWLRRAAEAPDAWVPWRFELAFGLPEGERGHADPTSVRDPAVLPGGLRLRGSIDLVERRDGGALRATDHKTGKARAATDVVVGGGQILQPVLYALACEAMLGMPVDAGRLYYCTADGGFQERVVPLDAESRASAATVVDVIGRALATGFLPAAPVKRACDWCDYRPVCGPYEEIRTAKKPPDKLADLARLRALR